MSKKCYVQQTINGVGKPKAPVFEARPQDVVAVEGANVVLECAANGFPAPTIQWLKDQKVIGVDGHARFRRIGQGSLLIQNLQGDDSGHFTCRATNSQDSADSSAYVSTHGN